MEKTYNPKSIEPKWQSYWADHEFGKPSGQGAPYCIMLPPPNVTGTLHMGHGFQHTLMDALVRFHRMRGENVLWQGGTDHAGIATQMVVERQLNQQGQTRHDLGREKFIERIWQWRDQSGDMITSQMRRLGLSLDWSTMRFTMDEGLNKATYTAFIQLFNEGLIYRGKKLVNWDPVLQTAVSDLEVETEQANGKMWHLRYPMKDGGFLIVATTRPETMLGDVAVAVHPEDTRYKKLIGKKIKLPLTDREIPIIADDYVDKEFGSGCVKITPAHDFNDYQIGKRHNLALINILTDTAHLNDEVPAKYRGLERFAARKQILADLAALDLIEKEEPHVLSIPRGERSGTIIEPYLTYQWFVNAKALADPALDALKKGELTFIPENWQNTYRQWLENIEDWCISRQLWWGHRIPVWYDEQDNHYVGFDEADARQKNSLNADIKLTQENDVLDTWFSSSLWPFATLGWPDKTKELETFYPTNVLVTGFDIIFFWVARMVMMGIKLTGKVPFHQVYITGLIRDKNGKKMSKSKGNILDPIDLIDGIELDKLLEKRTFGLMQPQMREQIEKQTRAEFPNVIASFGTDALRFTFCALANTGRDINFDLNRIEGYRNFCNKIWNATRFVLMNVEDKDCDQNKPHEFGSAELWIQSRLQKAIAEANKHFSEYRFDLLAQGLYEFIWNEYCDWYLEFAKTTLNNPASSEAQLRGTRVTLLRVLETSLRLLHPIMPFITEEIWQKIAPMLNIQGESIMVAAYPSVDEKLMDSEAESAVEWLKNVIIAVRTIRSEMNVSPAKKIDLLFYRGDKQDKAYTEKLNLMIQSLARINTSAWAKNSDQLAATAMKILGDLEIHIPLADLIDKDEEIKRLNKEIAKLDIEIEKFQAKLQNEGYVNKAPAAVVEQERQRLAAALDTKEKLQSSIRRLT